MIQSVNSIHTTHSVIMVPPDDFAFNEQTGEDNDFQKKTDMNPADLKEQVLCEFNEMVNLLRDQHIEVLVLNKTSSDPEMPDAVFPNNWFSTHADGRITLYPMKTLNRQAEVRPESLKKTLAFNQYKVKDIVTIKGDQKALEGTGSIIFDHKHRIAYAAISERCDSNLFNEFCQANNFKPISFMTQSSFGSPFYHTNVMMSLGENFAVICLQSIHQKEQRETLLDSLKQSNKTIIDISLEQAEQSFCANILQLKNAQGELCIVMSESAYRGFSPTQIDSLKSYGKIIACPISTIERVGGASARCMLAENFLPKT